MSSRPVIFISAVSKELHTARDLVAKTLLNLGYEPKWQDIEPTEAGVLTSVLTKWIDDSAAVIQLIGKSYGYEAPQPDPTFGRCSYTQYEALYAKQCGKKVWYIPAGEGYPCDTRAEESEELRQLQADYLQSIRDAGDLRHWFNSAVELENIVLKLRDDLAKLRRRYRQVVATVLALLVLIAAGTAWVMQEQQQGRDAITQVRQQNDKLLQAMHELPQTLNQSAMAGQGEDESTRLARAYSALETKLQLPLGSLEKELPAFAQQILARSNASSLDRASALFATKKFNEAESAALEAKDQALAGASQSIQLAIASLELAGNAAREQIQYVRAIKHFRAASTLINAQRDPLVFASLQWSIAAALDANGQYREAVDAFRESVSLYQRQLGADHPLTLINRSNLATALNEQGRANEAETELQAVRSIQERLLGTENPVTLATRLGLASVLLSQGKYVEGEAENRAVLIVAERTFGTDHPFVLTNRNNLALALRSQGKYAEAELEHRAVLAIRVRVLGAQHPETLSSRMNFANALYSQGKAAEAEVESRMVLAMRQRVIGPEHPDTLSSRNNLANILFGQRKYPEAEAEYRMVLSLRQRVLGVEHPDTLGSLSNLATCLSSQGKNVEAEEEYRSTLSAAERVQGSLHPEVLQTCYNLALCLEDQNKLPEALELVKRAETGWQKVLGGEHLLSQRAKKVLARIQQKLRDQQK